MTINFQFVVFTFEEKLITHLVIKKLTIQNLNLYIYIFLGGNRRDSCFESRFEPKDWTTRRDMCAAAGDEQPHVGVLESKGTYNSIDSSQNGRNIE